MPQLARGQCPPAADGILPAGRATPLGAAPERKRGSGRLREPLIYLQLQFPRGLKQRTSLPLAVMRYIAMRTRIFRWLLFQDSKAFSLAGPLLYPSRALEGVGQVL